MADKKVYDNNMSVSIWERQSRDGGIFLSGQVEIDGTKYNITLNQNNSENPKAPKWRGKLKLAD